VLSFPSPDSKEPIKNNILYLFWKGYNLELDILYRTLCNMREMPTGKDKYRGIERALKQLQKEGWPIHMEPDGNGITWYSAGEGFGQFMASILYAEVGKIRKESSLREVRRLNEMLEINHRLNLGD
jgi:hypothetical protein